MPNVPYDPTPKIGGPAFVGERFRAPSALGEAMGTGVARARMELGAQQEKQGIGIENVGQALGSFGDKIAQVAMAQQELNNETWAKNADVDTMTKMGNAENDFNMKEGLNRVQALPAFQEQIKGIREEALANAPNPRAKEMLDGVLARRVGFTLLNAGRSAGTAGREAADKASEVRKQSAIDNFDANNGPDAQDKFQTITEENAHQGRQHGWDQKTVDDINERDKSTAVIKSLEEQTDAEKARTIYDRYAKGMPEQFRQKAEKIVQQLESHTGARDAAQKIMAGQKVVPGGPELTPFDPSKGPGQKEAMLAEGRRVAESDRYKANVFFKDNIETYLKQGMNTSLDGHEDTMHAYEGALKKFVMGTNPQNRIVDMDAIYNDPTMNKMYNALDDGQKAAFEKYVSSANKHVPETAENIALFKELLGMARNNPNEFVKLPLVDQAITHGQLERLVSEQSRIILKKEPDLSVSALTTNTKDIASAVGVAPGPSGSAAAKRWNRYVGGMLEAELDWRQQNPGKVLDSETQRALAAHELKDVLVHKAEHWWQSDARMKRFEVPQEEVDKATEVLSKKLGRDPTHAEVNELLDATMPEVGK